MSGCCVILSTIAEEFLARTVAARVFVDVHIIFVYITWAESFIRLLYKPGCTYVTFTLIRQRCRFF
jgi:hypothetical protein